MHCLAERCERVPLHSSQHQEGEIRVNDAVLVGDCSNDDRGGGGGEIYTGCQPPNNIIALYKLESHENTKTR